VIGLTDDLFDPDPKITLAVALAGEMAFSPDEVDDIHLGTLDLVLYFSNDLGPGYERRSDPGVGAFAQQEDPIELHRIRPFGQFPQFNVNDLSFLDLVLLAAVFDYCVHA
jgi:hypothetical protein